MSTLAATEVPTTLHASDPSSVGAAFRVALSRFCSGVVVITAMDTTDTPVGMTVGSFTSISLDPPLVGFFASQTSTTLPHLIRAERLCINVLAEDQDQLAQQFARSAADRFSDVGWSAGANGAPRLDGAHAWIEGTLTMDQTIGDHDLLVCHVDVLTVPEQSEPLVFHRSAFRSLRAS